MKRSQVFKCADSKMVVEVLTGDDCCENIECCGKAMQEMTANTVDASKEKHVPVASASNGGIKVKVGEVEHPMTDAHYIEWIEVVNGQYVNRKYLNPNEAPEAEFFVPMSSGLKLRIYCNLHGLWEKQL
ncbi:MAG: desulfoferrodoxin family protein [Victivallaceae bacterium]|jgi:superoxide reductase|nr:desulfoferrodoxin family protein [Victivallaceae bacterium]NLK84119.1 hypothetical protein [Lentisphaerota bacterium]MDD3116158.1 desulfoferrodoxin family protein [Victivallaceae bacterium]MDD3702972.1 desulfoferrodoxin family protein [Victivallaceae bacterium]MDD4317423.1 desulfoferrodoxin family protein [Victivallaceae bacterium]